MFSRLFAAAISSLLLTSAALSDPNPVAFVSDQGVGGVGEGYRLDCPTGEWLVGTVSQDDNSHTTFLTPACRRADAAGFPVGEAHDLFDANSLTSRRLLISPNGTPGERGVKYVGAALSVVHATANVCAEREFVTGIETAFAQVGTTAWLARFAFKCQDLHTSAWHLSPPPLPPCYAPGCFLGRALLHQRALLTCPSGYAAVGIFGRALDEIYTIGLVCSSVNAEIIASAIDPSKPDGMRLAPSSPSATAGTISPSSSASANESTPISNKLSSAALKFVSTNSSASLFALTSDNHLLRYTHEGAKDGTPQWSAPTVVSTKVSDAVATYRSYSPTGAVVPCWLDRLSNVNCLSQTEATPANRLLVGRATESFSGSRFIFPGPNGVLYRVDQNGALLWQKQTGGKQRTLGAGSRVINSGWAEARFAFSVPEAEAIYQVDSNGDLWWQHHDGWKNGASVTTARTKIGNGWGDFKYVVSAGNGIIYAVSPSGDLRWYRHLGVNDGTAQWAPNSGAIVGTGWNNFVRVF